MDSIIDNSISKLGDTIKNTTLAKNNSTRLTTDLFSNIGADQPKQRFESYTQYKPDEVYATLSSGEKVAKFENYIPGSNNNERLAQNQTSTEQIFNGLTKAGNNMLTTILGNTAGFVYGIANGVKEGNMNAVFDNSFSKTLDDWNTKLNYQLPNYVTEDNKNKGFFGSLTDDTANFIFNDVAQGFSFTLGTAVSEAIWAYATGGTSLATSAARVGARAASLGRLVRGTEELGALGRWSKAALGAEQVGLGVSKYKSFLNTAIVNEFKAGKLSKDAAIALGKAGDVLTTARFIGTTSSNEAGIEAFHFKKEARENFENNFERQYGREATAEERAEFESDLASAANGVYYTNMAILSVSNLAMFGGLFNIKTPFKSLEKQMNKSLFGIGTREVEKGVFKGIEATKGQKIFTGAYQILKPTFTEGVFEEGLQGVTTKVANKWTDSTYNPKYHDQTLSLASAAYESMAEQYGTKEGWKEIGIGGIIGLFGVFGKGGSIAKTKEARKYQEDYVAKGLTAFGEKSLFAQDAFVSSILRDAKIQGSIAREQDAIKRGDAVGAHLAQSDKIIAEAQYREPMGGNLDDLKLHAKIAMNSATEDMWNEAGIKEEDRENFIQATLTGYNQVIDSYKEASNFANALVGNGAIRGTKYQTQVIKDALTHAIVSGEVSHVAMNESLRDITKYIGEENAKAVEIVGSLWQLSKAKQNQVKTLTKEHEDITEKEAEVEKKLAELQAKPKSPTEADTTTGTQLQKLAALRVSLQERKTQIEQEQDTIASEIQQLNQRRAIADETSETDLNTSTISGQDLRDIDKKMSNIDAIIEGYSGTNKIDHNNLMTAMKQYKSARDTFYTYQGTVDAISNGKFKIKNKSGFLFKLFDANYKMDDFTTEFLADIYNRHINGYMELGAEEELKNIKAELVTLEATTEKTEEQQKRIEEINKRIAVLEKEPSLQERKEALERELESIQDTNSSRIAEIDAELNEIEKQLTPNDTPNISQEALVKSQIEALERERDERLAELGSQPTQVISQQDEEGIDNIKIDEELNRLQKEYDKKISDLEQERADLLRELAKKSSAPEATPQPEAEKVEEPVTPIEAITQNLTEEEKDTLEQVAEENKSEGQTTEDFVKEEIKRELNGETSNLKGDATLIEKFKAILKKLAKIFAIGAVIWTTANPMADFLGRNEIITREKTQFVIDIANAPSTITENSLSESQIAVLKQAIENAKSKGQTYVTYKEYPNQFAGVARVNPQTDTLGENIANVDSETVVKRLIGQFSFVEENGNYIVTDKYNFNDAGQKSFSEGIQFIKEGFESGNSTYSNIRRIGTVFGSIEGDGANVKITVPIKTDKKTTDTPQKASLAGLGLLALLRRKNKNGEALSEEDLLNGKNRIAEIDAEITRLKNELLANKEDLNRGKTYSKATPQPQTPQQTTDNTAEKEKINKEYDQKIAKLKQQITPTENKTELEVLKDRIAEIVKNLRAGYISKDIDEMTKNRPDQKDMDRYMYLSSIVNGVATTTEKTKKPSDELYIAEDSEKISSIIDNNKIYVLNGLKGIITLEGQQVVFESGNRVYELGNKDEIANNTLSDFNLLREKTNDIEISGDNTEITINGKKYYNRYSKPESAVAKTKDDYSISLETENGQKRTIRGAIAEQIAYQITLNNFEKNATDEQIDRALEQARKIAGAQETDGKTNIKREKYGVKRVREVKTPTREEVIEEYEELYNKLSNWRIYGSLVDGQDSIVDLLDYIQQMGQEVGEKETLNVDEKAISFLGEDTTPVGFVANLGNNTNFAPTARLINKDVVLTHLKIATIISRIPNAEVTVKQPNKKKLENPSKEVLDALRVAEITIKEGVNEYTFKLTQDGRLAINAEVFKSISQLLNIYTSVEVTKKYVNWSWHPLMEVRDGGFVPMKSDFTDEKTKNTDSFDLEEGDTVELYVDVEDAHSKKIAEGKNKDELVSQVRIYIRKNGKLYNDLKALPETNTDSNFLELREAAAKQFLTGKSGVIGTTTITYVPLGLPIMTLGSDNTIQPIEITQDAVKAVETTGYILNGEIVLADKSLESKVRRSFISKISKANQDKKVPVVVFKRGVHHIAFPITMTKTAVSRKVEFEAIKYGQGTQAQKVKDINNLLLENGIAPKTYGLTSWDDAKLETIQTALENLEDSVPASALAERDYDKNSLIADAKIALDLADIKQAMPSQKLNYDLENIDYTKKKAEPKAKVTVYDVETEEQEDDEETFVPNSEIEDLVETGEVPAETITNVAKKISKKKPLSKNEEIVAEVKEKEVSKKVSVKKPVDKFTPQAHTTKKFQGVRYFYANDVWNTKENGILTPVSPALNKKLTKNSADKKAKPVEIEEEETVLPSYEEVTVVATDTKAQEAEYNKKTTAIETLAIKLNKLNFNTEVDDIKILSEDEQELLMSNLKEVSNARYNLKPKVVTTTKATPTPKAVKTTADPTESITIYENFFKMFSKKAVKSLTEQIKRIIKNGQSEMVDAPIVNPTQEDIDNNTPPFGAIYYREYKSTSGAEEIEINRFNGERWLEFNYNYVGKFTSEPQAERTKKYFAQVEINRAEKPLNC